MRESPSQKKEENMKSDVFSDRHDEDIKLDTIT